MYEENTITFVARLPLNEDTLVSVKHYTEFLLKLVHDAEAERDKRAKEWEKSCAERKARARAPKKGKKEVATTTDDGAPTTLDEALSIIRK
jgi:predicted HicB family RNase H-like nuclease